MIQIATGVLLKERFTYTIHLTPSGNLTVNAHEMQWGTKLDPSWNGKQLYFKAGVYTQDNTGYATEGGAATFYKLQIAHDKKSDAFMSSEAVSIARYLAIRRQVARDRRSVTHANQMFPLSFVLCHQCVLES